MIYLDTSILAAIFFREPDATNLVDWLEKQRPTLSTSSWTLTEMASASGIKERTGQIDATGRAEGMAAFDRFTADMLTMIEIVNGDFRVARVLIEAPPISLRAGDALHLAVCRRTRATLVTLDSKMAQAATHYNIPISSPAQ